MFQVPQFGPCYQIQKKPIDLHGQICSRKTESKPSNSNSTSKNNHMSIISGLVALRESWFNKVILCHSVSRV